MIIHFEKFMEKTELPIEAKDCINEAFYKIFPAFQEEMESMVDFLYQGKLEVEKTQKLREELSEKSGVNIYTLNHIFLICASKKMLEGFLEKGIKEEIYWETICDLNYKVMECKAVKGEWGNFVETWYDCFFALNIVKLGRLEFERSPYYGEKDYNFGEISLKKGDIAYSVHVPSCGKLTKELRMESYKNAYNFFKDELKGKPLVCFCDSWLLFKDNKKIFPPYLNMIDFMDDWDIIINDEKDGFHDSWRIFSMDYNGDVKSLPQNTTQQKAMAKWLETGNKTGNGIGILIFDGEKIINKKGE